MTQVEQLMALVDALETQLAASRATAAILLDALVAELTADLKLRWLVPEHREFLTWHRARCAWVSDTLA